MNNLILLLFTGLITYSCSESIVTTPPDVDLIPQFELNTNTHVVGDTKDQVFRIRNIGTDSTEGIIGILVSNYSAFSTNFIDTQTVSQLLLGVVNVDNIHWNATIFPLDTYIETSISIPPGGENKVALNFEAILPNQVNDIQLTIVDDAGGDIDNTNNTTTKILVIAQ